MPRRRKEVSDTIGEFIEAWRRERPDLNPAPLGILGRVQRISARLIRATEELLEPTQIGWEAFSLIVSLRRCGQAVFDVANRHLPTIIDHLRRGNQ